MPSWRKRIFQKAGSPMCGDFAMVKKPKLPVETPPNDDEVIDKIEGAFDSADDADETYNDDRDADDADLDHLPDEEEESANEEVGSPLAGDSLLRPEELKYLKGSAERMRRSVSYMKCDDLGNYTINDKDVTGTKALAIPDLLISQRTLFVGGKGVEAHGHFMKDLKGKPPPRPNTFNNRARWKEHHKNGKDQDPWNNIQPILAFKTGSDAIIALQGNSAATKAAIGELLAAFIESGGKRRPIVEFSNELNPETGQSFPVLRIVKYVEANEDFSYLREMLIRDDPEYPEPEEKKDSWSTLYRDDE
jgi:hypothetical protein